MLCWLKFAELFLCIDEIYLNFQILIKAIAKWDKEKFGYLVPDFVIGYNSSGFGSEETALHKRQEEVHFLCSRLCFLKSDF